MKYITQPIIISEKYLLVPFGWKSESINNYDIPLNCTKNIKVVFTHDADDYRKHNFMRNVAADKIFCGHHHKRNFPKTKRGKVFAVGSFKETGFIVYDDLYNTITEYDINGIKSLDHQLEYRQLELGVS